MTTIVFNPDWVAPETVVKENILPPLQRRSYSILKIHKLSVSYNGTPVDPTKVDWNRVNPLAYTFSQKAGPPQQSRQGEIPLSQPAHRLHARHAAGAEEILQGAGAHDRA